MTWLKTAYELQEAANKVCSDWRVIKGCDVTEEEIEAWVIKVNGEFGKSKDNAISIEFMSRMLAVPNVYALVSSTGYAVVGAFSDYWGEMELNIISYYLEPRARRLAEFMRLQRMFALIARELNCRYIVQGAHLDPRLFIALRRMGYKDGTMKLEVGNGSRSGDSGGGNRSGSDDDDGGKTA